MKKSNSFFKVLFAGLAVFTSVITLAGCKKQLTDTPLENMQTIADFSNGKQKEFFPSDGWTNGEPFNVTWSGENIKYQEGAAKLIITEKDDKFYGGELRSSSHYWYGDYEITMKPDPKTGTCSSFFVYTGPSETDAEGNPNPHDEIDIEFLGKDTTHVQFNFFVNGVGGNEYKYDLGFDASEEYHTYGFRWTETYITWYVDGVPVYRVDETAKKPLPKTPGRLMMNYWCGTKQAELWMSKYSHPEANDGSYYKIVKTSAEPIVGESATNDIDWSQVNALADLTALGDDKHVVTANGTAYNVVYNGNVGATYTNVKFELEEKAKDTNYLYLKATNNDSEKTSIRVDVFGDATRKTVNNKYVCNVAATMDGQEVATDLNWGGSSFNNILPGETVEIVIYFEGVAESIQIMFETHIYGDTETHSGNVTISDIKFTKFGDLVLPEGGNEEEQQQTAIKINGVDKTFEGNLETYTLSASGNALTATYTNVGGASYHNINTQVNDIAADKNQVTLKITNNGSVLARVRIDVDSTTKVNETTACNVSATMNGQEVATDTTWGGSTFEVPAGATVVCVVKYDNTRGVKQLMFYIDSSKYDDTETHTGSVVISEVNFELVSEGGSDQGGNENENQTPSYNTVVDWSNIPALEGLTANADDKHVITAEGSTYNVVYTNNGGATYTNVAFQLGDKALNMNYAHLKVTNNGSKNINIRIDVFGDATRKNDNNQVVCNVSATMNGVEVPTDLTWGGSTFEIAAGATVEIEIYYEGVGSAIQIMLETHIYGDTATHSGNVTISDIKMGVSGELKLPSTGGNEPAETKITINGASKEFAGNLETYTLTYATNELTIDYANVGGASYHNINTQVNDIAADKNQVTLTITNNGSELARVRVDIDSNTKVNETTACNVSATMNGSEVYTDTTWGGTVFEVAPGATVVCVVKYDNTRGVKQLMFYIDSAKYDDTASHTGSVTITDINFSE